MTDTTEQIPLEDALRRLEAEAATPKPQPTGAKTELTGLPLSRIRKLTAVFQPRTLDGYLEEDEAFIHDLRRALKSTPNNRFDPITVWWSGQQFYVIEGHHRLETYRREWDEEAQRERLVPVTEFKGTVSEAMEFAGQANHKNKLAMRHDMRMSFAWRLVCVSGLPVDRIVNASGVSKRSVITMRNKLAELIERDRPQDAISYKRQRGGEEWWRVRSDQPKEEITDWEKVDEQESQKLARFLARRFNGKITPNRLARAIVILKDTLPVELFDTPAFKDYHEEIATLVDDQYERVEDEDNEQDEDDEDTGKKVRFKEKLEF